MSFIEARPLMRGLRPETELALSLRPLLTLRWIAIGAQLGVILLTEQLFGAEVAIAPAFAVCTAKRCSTSYRCAARAAGVASRRVRCLRIC